MPDISKKAPEWIAAKDAVRQYAAATGKDLEFAANALLDRGRAGQLRARGEWARLKARDESAAYDDDDYDKELVHQVFPDAIWSGLLRGYELHWQGWETNSFEGSASVSNENGDFQYYARVTGLQFMREDFIRALPPTKTQALPNMSSSELHAFVTQKIDESVDPTNPNRSEILRLAKREFPSNSVSRNAVTRIIEGQCGKGTPGRKSKS